jgi:hypothetical protein
MYQRQTRCLVLGKTFLTAITSYNIMTIVGNYCVVA